MPGVHGLWRTPWVSKPICHLEESSECQRRWWLARMTGWRRQTHRQFSQHFLLSSMVHTREPLGPTSNSSSSSHSRDSQKPVKETRSHLNQQDVLTAPLADAPLPIPNAQPAFALRPLRGCMHCLYCTEKGRDSRSEVERERAQHQLTQPLPYSPELAAL